ncbi:histidine kinase [Hymenobacter chitinivorans]|uniref:Histidine kinase n=1 Tax=Hymenobacter chitinivorans DSM 11115 TaxID=1121954 RepID=A0A2M9BQD8_9BACT|nr:histidine kinase [Hymenobacter chitinivorans]PJJ60165.1 histidine kinase [Hymenobacter chitinivorans DSM 11115]
MYRLSLYLCFLLALASCQPDVEFESAGPLFRTGDDPRWAAPRYDDSGWQNERSATGNQVFWVRHHVGLPQWDSTALLGVVVRSFGGFEVYWDGSRIGRNGRPASATRPEVPGTETSYYLVPAALAKPGPHVVALRATQAHLTDEQRFSDVKLHSYPRLLRDPLLIMAFVNLMAGALLLAAIYYLFLFSSSSQKDYGTLIFSSICLLCFALLMMEYVKFYVDIPYPHFYTRLTIIGLLTFAIALLVPLYFALQFGLPRKGFIAGGLLAGLSSIYLFNYPHYDQTAIYLSLAMWAASLVIVLLAIRRRAKGSILVLTGLLASAVTHYFLYFDYSLYITFTVILLCMLYLHALRVRVMENERQAAQQLSSRLKLELLKKHIQPHFIKNTLTSMLDWVEESPRQGAVFIQALAREFDLLNDMAEATLIPLGKELELCEHHLQVMQFRKEVRYELEQAGLDPEELIPPAIFHTILENGITHSIPAADGSIRFRLSAEACASGRKYELLTRAQNRPAEPGTKVGTGTGLQYIKARLTESYGTGWQLHSGAVPEGWLTSITIHSAR